MVLYALMDCRPGFPCEPFYVGIGNEKRRLQHVREAKSARKHSNYRVQEMVDAHLALGIVPESRILVVCPDREYAWDIEEKYIAKLGRKGIDENGILCNLSPGGSDAGGDLPHVKKAKSDATKKLNASVWSDPVKRATRIAAMRGKKKTMTADALESRRKNAKKASTPEANLLKKAAAIKAWEDQDYRVKLTASRKAAWDDPDKRANMLEGRSEGISLSWQNPEVRDRRIDGIKAASLRRNDAGD